MPDFKTHCRQFAAHLVVPKAQHLDAFARKKTVPFFIPRPLVGKAMSAAIQLHLEFCGHALEIQKVNAAAILPAKFEINKAPVA